MKHAPAAHRAVQVGTVVVAAAAILSAVAWSRPMFNRPGVVIVERPWPPLVDVHVHVPVGSLADPAGKAGLTELTWRTAVQAGGKRHSAAFARELDRIGATIGADVGMRSTEVWGQVALPQVDAFMALLADVVLRPRLSKADLERQRALHLADIMDAMDDDAALASDAAHRFLYRGLPEGRPVHGDVRSVEALGIDDVRAAHRKALKTGLRFGFAGALPRQRAVQLVRDHFPNSVRPAAKSRRKTHPHLPIVRGRRLLLLDRPGRTQAQIILMLPTAGASSPEMPGLALAATALGGTFSSRLTRQLRELRGWTYTLDAGLRVSPYDGAITVQWAPENRVAAASIDLVARHIELLIAEGLSARELAFFRDHLQGAHTLALETAAGELSERLRALALGLPVDYPQRMSALLNRIERGQHAAMLRKQLDPSRMVIVVVGDGRALLPHLSTLASRFAVQRIGYSDAPELTTLVGTNVSKTPVAAPPPEEDSDDSPEVGPDFDQSGDQVDLSRLPRGDTETDDDDADDH